VLYREGASARAQKRRCRSCGNSSRGGGQNGGTSACESAFGGLTPAVVPFQTSTAAARGVTLLVLRLPYFFVHQSQGGEQEQQPRPLSHTELHHAVLRAGALRLAGE
jgi:hypothetical protein